ncbi:hypothetical protein HMPREF1545_04258 [Oscillibacter sp. KLE 1728]|nr:hypothetical protein HMPREF1545_04258 [Oscillibacter sp. KLE 1728]
MVSCPPCPFMPPHYSGISPLLQGRSSRFSMVKCIRCKTCAISSLYL